MKKDIIKLITKSWIQVHAEVKPLYATGFKNKGDYMTALLKELSSEAMSQVVDKLKYENFDFKKSGLHNFKSVMCEVVAMPINELIELLVGFSKLTEKERLEIVKTIEFPVFKPGTDIEEAVKNGVKLNPNKSI